MRRPSTWSGKPSSCGEHIMPWDSTPRILPTLMVKGCSPGFAGRLLPGRIRGTLSPALKFWAPQTICRSPAPSLTRQTESLSALGCLSRVMTWATTMPSNSPPSFWMPSTSMPSMVRRSASSSGDQLKSTYCLSQLRVTFISELPQEPGVILIEEPDIIDAITKHCDALDAEAEGPAGPDFGVVTDVFEDLGVNHAATGDFEPFFAHLAGERAAEIDFEARFGVAEIVWAKANAGFGTHQFLEDELDRAL